MTDLFIHATVARHFDGPDGLSYDTRPGDIGEAPEWLKTNDYFNLCVSDGSITYVGAPPVAVTVKNKKKD